MFEWIKTQMLGGFTGIAFSKEPIVWLGTIAVVAQLSIAVLTGDLNLWPEGIEAIGTALLVLVGRGAVTPSIGRHAAP